MNNTALELHRLFSPSLFYFPLSLLSVFPLWIVQIIWVLKSASPDPKVSARRPIRMLEHNCWMNASAAGVASECQVHSNAECKWEAPKLVDGSAGIVGKSKMENPLLMREQHYGVPFGNNETFEICSFLFSELCFPQQLCCCLSLSSNTFPSLHPPLCYALFRCLFLYPGEQNKSEICLKKNIIKMVIY